MSDWLKSIISLVFLAIMLVIGYQQTQAPAALADSDLDYDALLGHVSAIAGKPHPMGSAANKAVRDYIVRHFESLGLLTEVQKTTVVYRHPFRERNATIIATVENIIARLPGQAGLAGGQGGDLVLMGHYDSRPLTPGAADDASGTASIMEVARVMAAGPKPLHDVVFLITDGEEMGLLGAQGFFRQHPAAGRVGLVLNFEARGSHGASSMFETSDKNAWLIDNLVVSAPDLVASSLSYEVYRRMPNDTDMSISKGEGIPGLNFAFVSGLSDYHAVTDTPENLDKNTLAQQANYALATARHFAMLEEWHTAVSDKTYFNLWQGAVVSYSQPLAIGLGLVVLIFGFWVFVSCKRAGGLNLASLGNGLVAIIVLVLMISNLFESMIEHVIGADAGIARLLSLGELPLLAYFVTTLGVCAWFAAAIRRRFSAVEVGVITVVLAVIYLMSGRPWFGVVPLTLILLPSMLYLRKRKYVPDLWAAALLLWWLFTAVVLYFAPNGSYLLVWPLVSALVLFAVQRRNRGVMTDIPLVSSLSASFVPLLLATPLIIMAYLALGTSLPQAIMVIVVLVLLLVWPLIQNMDSATNSKPGSVLLVMGLMMIIVVVFVRNFDARHPLGESLFYAFDGEQQTGFWVSPDAKPGSWLKGFLGGNAEAFNLELILPGYDEDVLIRRQDIDGFRVASLETTADRLVDGQREVSFHLQSLMGADYINILLPSDAEISHATVNGFTLEVPRNGDGDKGGNGKPDADKSVDKGNETKWWRWRLYGVPEAGVDFVLRMKPDHELTLRIIEVDYGLPGGAPERPPGSAPKPYTWSDSKVLYQTLKQDKKIEYRP